MMETVMNSVNTNNPKRKSEGEGSGVVVTPSGQSVHPPVSTLPSTSQCALVPKELRAKLEMDKGLDDLESTLEGYFTYIGTKITDVATAGTAPKSQLDPTGKNTCQVCGKVNASWLDMRKHMRTHSDYRPYKCNLCPRSFHDMYKLKRHLVVHSGLKPYQCHICDQRLSRAEHLRRHLLIHKDTKPFKCNLCEFAARRTDSIKSHQKSKHPGEWVHVVTIKSIAEIVTDATTVSTNLVPNPKRKKKKKKFPIISTPTIYPLNSSGSATSTSSSGIRIPSYEELKRISGLELSTFKFEPPSAPVPSAQAASTPSTTESASNMITSTTSSIPNQEQSQQGQPGTVGVHFQYNARHIVSTIPSPVASSRVSETPPSPAKSVAGGVGTQNTALNSPTAKYQQRPHTMPLSSGAHSGGTVTMMPTALSVPNRPPIHPVIGMNPTGSQPAGQPAPPPGLNPYYPPLPGQLMNAHVPGSQAISPYFTMKPVFPEAMPVNQHHGNRPLHGDHPHPPTQTPHHKQEPLNCSQVKPNLYHNNNNNSNNNRMSSPNS